MPRIMHILLFSMVCLPVGFGCAHFVETQAIQQFAAAIEHQDLEQLRSTTSPAFQQKALRMAEAMDDLKVLNLPTGEVAVVNVEDADAEDGAEPNQKRVTVEVGERKRRLLYLLTRDSETGEWVVDDVYVKQKKKGMSVAKSVTEQMDLLLSIREFIAAWSDGSHEDVLAVTTPDFSVLLAKLPPAYLARLTQRVIDTSSTSKERRPEARMDDDVAVVRLPRPKGNVVLSLKRHDGDWKVHDIAIESEKEAERVPSLRQLAAAAGTTAAFLDAYAQRDKTALSQLCTTGFFQGSLAPADLSLFTFPPADSLQEGDRFSLQGKHADFIVSGEHEMTRISLVRDEQTDPEAAPQYRVVEATVYEVGGDQQQIRLSALFTSQAIARIFCDALAQKDLKHLRFSATPDFRSRVWDRVTDATILQLPLDGFNDTSPRILDTKFRGALTEVAMRQGIQTVTCLLKAQNGQLLVDDVRVTIPGCPNSLKETLATLIPINSFAAAIRLSNIDMLQHFSSDDFNRVAWYQSKYLPELVSPVAGFLQLAPTSVEITDTEARVQLGDTSWGAQIYLVKRQNQYFVDDVIVMSGKNQQSSLKNAIRTHIAEYRPETTKPLVNTQGSVIDSAHQAVPQPNPTNATSNPFPAINIPLQAEPTVPSPR